MPVDNCGCYGSLDVGGQLRLRYHHEIGMGQDLAGPGVLRFEDTVHDFLLTRMRLYDKLARRAMQLGFMLRASLPTLPTTTAPICRGSIDRNFGDFLNGFIDYSPDDCLTLRVGRQELLYGAERLISPLDWANTRRTFEGVKLMYHRGRLENRRVLHALRARGAQPTGRGRLQAAVLRSLFDLQRLGIRHARRLLHRLRQSPRR